MNHAATTDMADAPVLDEDPFSDENIANPYPLFERMREMGPAVFVAPHGYYAVTRHAEAGIVASDHTRFTVEGGVGMSDIRKPGAWRTRSPISEIDPPEHTRVRAALQKILSPLVVKTWKDKFAQRAEEIAEQAVARGRIDGVADITEAFVLEVFPAVLGIDVPPERIKLTGELNFNQLGPNNERVARTLRRAAPIMDWYQQVLQRDHMRPGGFAEKIYEAEDAGDFDAGTAPLHVRSFFRAGVDTTIAGIGSTLKLLSEHPEQLALVKANPTLLKSAFEEALRMESPAQVMFRTTTGEVELGGVRLRADTKVGYHMGAANRDPRQWEDPDRYDVTRQTAGVHRAFGVGAHVCIGQMISRLEAESILGALIRRVQRIEPAGEARWRPVNTLRTLDVLPLTLVAG
ncbi:Biotin biosynthesis cytochrome P450 [Variovorax sp. SRS16]|uniref:cytochrome P450 n=1 Tax=Variovorax sp. SRS16 TaxID=282217 RepID=UPI001315BB7C|nr:cytochrome P450 [Variovorax sp. SRS16]VTU19022.1 Biotin biosynthesis cytochrome P450 [Variovorax sp. SRS16]